MFDMRIRVDHCIIYVLLTVYGQFIGMYVKVEYVKVEYKRMLLE
jgi:hypothetical protein